MFLSEPLTGMMLKLVRLVLILRKILLTSVSGSCCVVRLKRPSIVRLAKAFLGLRKLTPSGLRRVRYEDTTLWNSCSTLLVDSGFVPCVMILCRIRVLCLGWQQLTVCGSWFPVPLMTCVSLVCLRTRCRSLVLTVLTWLCMLFSVGISFVRPGAVCPVTGILDYLD